MTPPDPHRRATILDAAERRFTTQGYLATSVAELIADAGIAKGTFYHHFSSKEEVMEAVIDRHVAALRTRLDALADDHERPALDRLFALLGGASPGSDALASELERGGNELMRLRALNATVTALTPPLARILDDGRIEGSFHFVDDAATAAIFATITTQLVDRDLMGWVRLGEVDRLMGLVSAAEQLLGTARGALAPLGRLLAGAGGDEDDTGGEDPR